MIVPVILAGGIGSRLWPLSRANYPKQFIDILGVGESLFQSTLRRLDGSGGVADPIVVCNEAHRFIVAEQLRLSDKSACAILLEPEGRDTAPAIALAAMEVLAQSYGDDAVMLVLPADHQIKDTGAFIGAVEKGLQLCQNHALLTFGVLPTRPEVGYGYIRKGEADPWGGFCIDSFKEKPSLEIAKDFVTSGNYLWNSGMFMFRPAVFLNELALYEPELMEHVTHCHKGIKTDLDFKRVDTKVFSQCPAISIDYAVMEKTDNGHVLALDADWNDIGNWTAVAEASELDADENSFRGDVCASECNNTMIFAESRLVAAVGLNDHFVIETADAVLIAPKGDAQKVKQIVSLIKNRDPQKIESHVRVLRPWGWYESVCISERFQVKRIIVSPGQKLSLQKHFHRAEHWVVVKGTARVIRGDEEITISEDQSSYIPIGTVHRLENPGVIPLEIIEVQTGSYLGENDIVRFEDSYGR